MTDRHYFPVTVSGGVRYRQTTPIRGGEQLNQLRWYHSADTGQVATLELSVLPDNSDTGPGFQVYNRASIDLGTAFLAAPRQSPQQSDGTDTGFSDSVPFVATGELQLTVTPADTGVVIDGRCYVW